MNNNILNDFIHTHEDLVYGVLKKYNIYNFHPLFDDYYQIGLINLAKAFHSFELDENSEESLFEVAGYAYQKVKWAILDQIRKDIRKNNLNFSNGEQELETLVIDSYEQRWCDNLDIRRFMEQLTTEEQQFLKERFLDNKTIKLIMETSSWSKRKIYTLRNSIGEKLKEYMEG